MFLLPLTLFFNRPKAVTITPEEIRIEIPMRKPIVIKKDDIVQISTTKNYSYSLRWLIRLFYVIAIPFLLYRRDTKELAIC